MKKNLIKTLKTFIAVIFVMALFMNGSQLTAQSYRIFEVSDLVRVFEDGYKLPPASDTIKLFGIRGEIISGQFAISAKKSITNVTVEVETLRNIISGTILPLNAVEWNFVGSVPLAKNTPNQPLSAITRPAPARFPEYLMSEKQINIKEKSYQAVWLTINIPYNAQSGNYTGRVTVKCGETVQSLPLNLIIYPLTIPVERHLKVVEWYSTSGFSRFHGIREQYSPEWFAMLGNYADNMVSHRQNIFQVPMGSIVITRSINGEYKFDFSRFDQIAQVFWSTGKMDFMQTGGIGSFGEGRWASTEINLADIEVINPETTESVSLPGKEVLPYLLPAIEEHLRQKGWLKKTFFSIHDEPSLHNALAWREISAYVHKYAPDLIRLDAIETTFLLNEIEVAVPKLDHFSNWNDKYRKWALKGHELWFYTVGIYQGSLFPNKTIDMPLIDTRIIHWLNYKYDAVGYLHWGWNQWNENPFQDVGMHIGDAWHVYPSKDGVLNSVRWEEMRNGIQDYEYFWMLENKIAGLRDSLGTRFTWIIPGQRGKEIAGYVIKSFADHSKDPQVLNNAKMQIVKELISFNTSPGIYIQTNPPEGSFMTGGSTVELFGWTEPGTKIVVNGQEIPVNDQGLFVEQFQVSVTRNFIKVQATGPKGSKEIIREYIVK